MAFRRAQTYEGNARALTDPKPAFVSIVQAGANQVPFNSVKMDMLDVEEIGDMHERIEAMRTQGHEIVRLEFTKGDTFPDEAAVRAWLEAGGYALDGLREADHGWVLENDQDTFVEGSTSKVETPESLGVVVFVGKLDPAAAAEKEEGEDTHARGHVVDAEPVAQRDDEQPAEETRTGKGEDEGEGDTEKSEEDEDAGEPATEKAEGEGDEQDEETEKGEDDETAQKVLRTVITYNAAHEGGTPKAAKDAEWDAGAERREATVDDLMVMSAWREDKPREDLVKGDFKFPHHKAAGQHSVVYRALSASIAVLNGGRGGANIPDSERSGVHRHLAKHYRDDFDEDAPELASREVYEQNLAISNAVFDEAQKAAKFHIEGDEARAKFDDFMAFFSDGMTLAEVLKDGDDGLPPGFYEATNAMIVAMRNNLMSGNTGGVNAVARDFGSLVVALANTFSFEDAERAERAQKMIDLFQEGLPSEERDDEEAEQAEDAGDNPVLKAIGELADTVKENQTKTDAAIAEVQQQVAATNKRVDEAEAGLTERVKTLEDRRQTRKGADAEGEGESPPPKESPLAGIRTRGLLGISANTGDPWKKN